MERYDMKPLEEYFSVIESPRQLMGELANLVFNYAVAVGEDGLEAFKDDVATIQSLYNYLGEMEDGKD